MNIKTLTITACGAMLLCAGCGDSSVAEQFEKDYTADKGNLPVIGNYVQECIIVGTHNFDPKMNVMDALYERCYSDSYDKSDSFWCMRDSEIFVKCPDFAFSKRRAALNLSRRLYGYSFKHYCTLDGVSGLIYNVAYIAQVPHKILRASRCMASPIRYIKSLIYLGLGIPCAVVGMVAAPVINTICHPIETLANLTVGVLPLQLWEFEEVDSYIGYVFRTNILYSLWDLIWGGIIYPLWQALTFWL